LNVSERSAVSGSSVECWTAPETVTCPLPPVHGPSGGAGGSPAEPPWLAGAWLASEGSDGAAWDCAGSDPAGAVDGSPPDDWPVELEGPAQAAPMSPRPMRIVNTIDSRRMAVPSVLARAAQHRAVAPWYRPRQAIDP
jgi:hypothetical protein